MAGKKRNKPAKPAKPRANRALAAVEVADIAIAGTVALDEEKPAGRWIGRFAELGDQPPLQFLFGATIIAGLVSRDRRLARTGLRMALSHSLATAAKAFVKDAVDRTRPEAAMEKRKYEMEPGTSRSHDLQSMPSGHSAGVVAMAGAAVVDYPSITLPVSAVGAAIVAAQLPSRNHFLTDALAGSAIGLVSLAIAWRILPAEPR